MNNIYDAVLGWPGLVVFMILIIVGVISAPVQGPTAKQTCEAKGGRYERTMKSYHECKMSKSVL